MQSGGSSRASIVEASTGEASKSVNGCNSPVMSSSVTSGWRFSVGGSMHLIREMRATIFVDLSTRWKMYVFEWMRAMILYGPKHLCMNDSERPFFRIG